jgi:DNA-binding response OmpR family regulator
MRKILLIEDDDKFSGLFKKLLERKFRMEVCEAEDGFAGFETYRDENPAMIFLDILMPRMNGVEFLTKLRETDKRTPVVVMSGMRDKESVEKMVGLGITDYIVKSDFVFQLESRVADILYSHDAVFK